MPKPPVILLAFANDREGQFLRSIAEEQRSIRKALAPLVEKGLLQLEELPNATASDIFDAFRTYKDRIRIFHYGGHAEDLEILLNGSDRPMDARGLAQFLGQQKQLELVFMNGCATAAQRVPFEEAGIPRLILTDTPISDKAALQFATQFYQSMAVGHPVKRSFEEAEGSTIAQLGDRRRSLLFEEEPEEDDLRELPWRLYEQGEKAFVLETKPPFPWRMLAIVGTVLLLLSGGGYWIRQYALPFDMQLPIEYPVGTAEMPHFKNALGEIQHMLSLEVEGAPIQVSLELDGEIEIPQLIGQSVAVPLSLNSHYFALVDNRLNISRNPDPMRLTWHPDLSQIRGRVRDEITSAYLSGVAIRLGNETIQTDAEGRFEIPVPRDQIPNLVHRLSLSKEGYQSVEYPVSLKAGAEESGLVLSPLKK